MWGRRRKQTLRTSRCRAKALWQRHGDISVSQTQREPSRQPDTWVHFFPSIFIPNYILSPLYYLF